MSFSYIINYALHNMDYSGSVRLAAITVTDALKIYFTHLFKEIRYLQEEYLRGKS